MSDRLCYYIVAEILVMFECCIYVWILGRLLPYRMKFAFAIAVVCSFLFQSMRFVLPDNAMLRCAAEIAIDTIIVIVFFKGKLLNKLIYPVIFYDLLFICDGITVLLFMSTGLWEAQVVEVNGTVQLIAAILSRLLLPIPALAFVKIWSKNGGRSFLAFLVPVAFFVAQLVFYPYEYQFYHSNADWMFTVAFLFGAISLCCAIIIITLRDKRKETETKLRIMEVQHREQLNYINEIQETYKGLNVFVHDARHHLDLINAFMLQGELQKAQDYIKTLYGDLGKAYINYTGNADIDSVIFSKQMICRDNISIRVKGRIPADVEWLDPVDLCVLLANGIQNAIDACAEITDASVDIQFKFNPDWLLISIRNPFTTEPVRYKKRLISSKGKGHGYGLESMESVSVKYNGHIGVEISNQMFTLDIMLQRVNLA